MGDVISFVQYTSVLGQFDLGHNKLLKDMLNVLSYVTLGFQTVTSSIPIAFDWRIQQTIITTGIPLLLVLVVLLAFHSGKEILWYFCLLASMGVIGGAGMVLGMLKDEEVPFDKSIVYGALAGGIVGLALCIFVFWAAHRLKCCHRCYQPDALVSNDLMMSMSSRMEKDTKVNNLGINIAALILGGLVSIAGILILVFVPFLLGLGLALLFIGLLVVAYRSLFFLQRGRKILWRFRKILSKNFMKILLILINLLYLPIMQNTLATWNCDEVTCYNGTRFPEDIPGIAATSCELCLWRLGPKNITANQSNVPGDVAYCPVALRQQLCQEETRLVMKTNYGIQCDDIWKYFFPSAVLVVISFGMGIPLLLYLLIKKTIHRYTKYPFRTRKPSMRIWVHTLVASKSITRPIFEPFRFHWRYWPLYELGIKAMVVIFSQFFAGRGAAVIGLIVMLLIHGGSALFTVLSLPLVSLLEYSRLVVVKCMLPITFLLAILMHERFIIVEDWISILLAVLNGLVFVYGIAIALYFFLFRLKVYKKIAAQLDAKEEREEGGVDLEKSVVRKTFSGSCRSLVHPKDSLYGSPKSAWPQSPSIASSHNGQSPLLRSAANSRQDGDPQCSTQSSSRRPPAAEEKGPNAANNSQICDTQSSEVFRNDATNEMNEGSNRPPFPQCPPPHLQTIKDEPTNQEGRPSSAKVTGGGVETPAEQLPHKGGTAREEGSMTLARSRDNIPHPSRPPITDTAVLTTEEGIPSYPTDGEALTSGQTPEPPVSYTAPLDSKDNDTASLSLSVGVAAKYQIPGFPTSEPPPPAVGDAGNSPGSLEDAHEVCTEDVIAGEAEDAVVPFATDDGERDRPSKNESSILTDPLFSRSPMARSQVDVEEVNQYPLRTDSPTSIVVESVDAKEVSPMSFSRCTTHSGDALELVKGTKDLQNSTDVSGAVLLEYLNELHGVEGTKEGMSDTVDSEDSPEEYNLTQMDVDSHIDEDAKIYMSRFFIIAGVFLFAALTLCGAGILQYYLFTFAIQPKRFTEAAEAQFISYGSWANFTKSCCCDAAVVGSETTERWTCWDGVVIYRPRIDEDDDGLWLRPFCSPSFTEGCELIIGTDSVYANCTPSSNSTSSPQTAMLNFNISNSTTAKNFTLVNYSTAMNITNNLTVTRNGTNPFGSNISIRYSASPYRLPSPSPVPSASPRNDDDEFADAVAPTSTVSQWYALHYLW